MNPHEERHRRNLGLIQERTRLVIPDLYVERVELGLSEAQAALRAPSAELALAALRELPCDTPAWQSLIRAVTIGETNFFRDREWCDAIETSVLVPLIEERARSGRREISLWSAGCSTGEEAFTLAMQMQKLLPDRRGWVIRIVETDINAAALTRARRGIFTTWSLREIPASALKESFSPIDRNHFELSPELRHMVEFRALNLRQDSYPDPANGFSDFDLIVCRNVLMYLHESQQLAVAGRLVRCSAPGGWLAVSPAEATAHWYRPLTIVNRSGAILFREGKDRLPDKPCPEFRKAKASNGAPGSRVVLGPSSRTQSIRHNELPLDSRPAVARGVDDDRLDFVRSLADRGCHADARTRCETAITTDESNFNANLLLAMICLETGDLATALDAARRASYLDPESAGAYFVIGSILDRQGLRHAAARKMSVVLQLLQASPGDMKIADCLDVTAGSLRENARGYLAHSASAPTGLVA